MSLNSFRFFSTFERFHTLRPSNPPVKRKAPGTPGSRKNRGDRSQERASEQDERDADQEASKVKPVAQIAGHTFGAWEHGEPWLPIDQAAIEHHEIENVEGPEHDGEVNKRGLEGHGGRGENTQRLERPHHEARDNDQEQSGDEQALALRLRSHRSPFVPDVWWIVVEQDFRVDSQSQKKERRENHAQDQAEFESIRDNQPHATSRVTQDVRARFHSLLEGLLEPE